MAAYSTRGEQTGRNGWFMFGFSTERIICENVTTAETAPARASELDYVVTWRAIKFKHRRCVQNPFTLRLPSRHLRGRRPYPTKTQTLCPGWQPKNAEILRIMLLLLILIIVIVMVTTTIFIIIIKIYRCTMLFNQWLRYGII